MSELKIKYIRTAELKPYTKNPRKNDKAIPAVAESIRQFGFKVPLVISADDTVIAGHTRLAAAKSLGIEEVPVIVADDLTDEQIKAFRLVDNKVAEISEWDMELLPLELTDIAADLAVFGFEAISEDEFGDSFKLEDGAKKPFQQISLTLHDDQAALLLRAIKHVYDAGEVKEYGGNENHNGNGMYEVVRQWAEQRKLS